MGSWKAKNKIGYKKLRLLTVNIELVEIAIVTVKEIL